MKNTTALHHTRIDDLLRSAGCTDVHVEGETLVALREGSNGRVYPLSVDLYEDETGPQGDVMRYRIRASRRYGLPVTCSHGSCPEEALAAVEWMLLDLPQNPEPVGALAGVV